MPPTLCPHRPDLSARLPLSAVAGRGGLLAALALTAPTLASGLAWQVPDGYDASSLATAVWLVLTLGLAIGLAVLWHFNHQLRQRLRHEQTVRELAEQAVTARGRFLGYLSHELRGTVGALSASAQLLHEGRGDRELEGLVLEGVRHAGGQLMHLLDSALEHERSFSHGLTLHPTPVALADWWRATMAPLQLAAHNKGLVLRQTPPPQQGLLLDGPRLGQVLGNLVHNAIKFTASGEVHVSAEWDGQRLLLRVADQGPGIAPSEQARIFQPYQQGEAAVRQRQGAGLGLAICAQIVAAMDGRMWLNSAPGAGCVFSVEVPAVAATSAAQPAATAPLSLVA